MRDAFQNKNADVLTFRRHGHKPDYDKPHVGIYLAAIWQDVMNRKQRPQPK
jgi:hypothetical protein